MSDLKLRDPWDPPCPQCGHDEQKTCAPPICSGCGYQWPARAYATIEVVSAVIIREGRILLTQRRADKSFPFAWESPGGKVKPLEAHGPALQRELHEELNLSMGALLTEPIWRGRVAVATGEADVTMYAVNPSLDELMPCEGQGLGWFTAVEMLGLPLTPGNRAASVAIVEQMHSTKESR